MKQVAAGCSGVTLVELLTTIIVLSVVSSFAVPMFTQLRRDTERTAVVNEFSHSLLLARSEALSRGHAVSLCPSRDLAVCATGRNPPWQGGWIVFQNTDRDEPARRDPGEEVIAVYHGWANGSIASNRPSYTFRPYTHAVINGTIVFCDARGSDAARAIIVNHAGRPRIARRDASNRPLACPD